MALASVVIAEREISPDALPPQRPSRLSASTNVNVFCEVDNETRELPPLMPDKITQ